MKTREAFPTIIINNGENVTVGAQGTVFGDVHMHMEGGSRTTRGTAANHDVIPVQGISYGDVNTAEYTETADTDIESSPEGDEPPVENLRDDSSEDTPNPADKERNSGDTALSLEQQERRRTDGAEVLRILEVLRNSLPERPQPRIHVAWHESNPLGNGADVRQPSFQELFYSLEQSQELPVVRRQRKLGRFGLFLARLKARRDARKKAS